VSSEEVSLDLGSCHGDGSELDERLDETGKVLGLARGDVNGASGGCKPVA